MVQPAHRVDPRKISAIWDEEAEIWFAESDDVPGLVAEAKSVDELVEILNGLIPDLLKLNSVESELEINELIYVLTAKLTRKIPFESH